MRSLSATWLSVKCGSPRKVAPDEHHRRAGRGCEQDKAGDVAVDLIGGKIGPEQPADEEPAQQRHRERLDRPIDEERHADAAPMLLTCQGGKVDLEQHGNDHQPDQHRNRQIDLGDFRRADDLKYRGEEMAERNAGGDAQRDPEGEVSFERGHELLLRGRRGTGFDGFEKLGQRREGGGIERVAHSWMRDFTDDDPSPFQNRRRSDVVEAARPISSTMSQPIQV